MYLVLFDKNGPPDTKTANSGNNHESATLRDRSQTANFFWKYNQSCPLPRSQTWLLSLDNTQLPILDSDRMLSKIPISTLNTYRIIGLMMLSRGRRITVTFPWQCQDSTGTALSALCVLGGARVGAGGPGGPGPHYTVPKAGHLTGCLRGRSRAVLTQG